MGAAHPEALGVITHARFHKIRAESGNILRCVFRAWVVIVALCIGAVAPITSEAQDYAEIRVELNCTWRSTSQTNHHRSQHSSLSAFS